MFRFMFFFSSRRRHTRFDCDWSSDVCSSDLLNGSPRIARHSCATSWPRTSPNSIVTTARIGTPPLRRNGGSRNGGSELKRGDNKASLAARVHQTVPQKCFHSIPPFHFGGACCAWA